MKLNNKDLKIIMCDISKDAGVIILLYSIGMGVCGFVNNLKDDNIIFDLFVSLPFFIFSAGCFSLLYVLKCIMCEFFFTAIIIVFFHLIKSTKFLMVFTMVLLVMICAYLLRLYFYVEDPIITAIVIDFLFMVVFFVPLYIYRPKKSIFFTIVSFVVIGACLLAVRINRTFIMINYLPVVLLALVFIGLFYKNISVNKSKLIIINILLIQTLDFFFILSLIGEMLIASLVAIGIYKAVVLFFRYRKYNEVKIFSNVLYSNSVREPKDF